jgi:hypothetical protein
MSEPEETVRGTDAVSLSGVRRPTREELVEVKEVNSHAFCPDGTSAAMICLAAFAAVGRVPEVKFVTYDTVDHDGAVAGPGQLWVDITPPRKRWEDWRESGAIVLDHHETSKDVVNSLGGVYGGPDDSGASLAFRNVMRILCPDRDDIEKWAKFAYLCMVRDTWKDTSPDWEEAGAVANALSFYTQKALLISASNGSLDLNEIIRFGKVLIKKAEGKAFRLAETSTFVGAGGLKFGFFNCTERLISETGHELLDKKGCDVAVGFYYTNESGNTDLCVSFRSRKGGFPVNKLAEHFKGGGHQPAAACRIKGAEDVSFNGFVKMILEASEVVKAAT